MKKEKKENKQYESKLVNRVDRKEWVFPTIAVSKTSGIVVNMTKKDPETGEGHGFVLVKDGDRYEGQFKNTWQLKNFIPVEGEIVRVEKEKKKEEEL